VAVADPVSAPIDPPERPLDASPAADVADGDAVLRPVETERVPGVRDPARLHPAPLLRRLGSGHRNVQPQAVQVLGFTA
ncbi:MAG: hypothetical protein AAGA15_16015, partial [Pseudomonadota bacterium]